MTLAEFILGNLEPILQEWEDYARSLPAAEGLDVDALRDHAEQMLKAVAADMAEPQTKREQEAKSKGEDPTGSEDDTAAETHAGGRQSEGFTLTEMVSEYRALRASVLRLWTRTKGSADLDTLDELTRFNEAIDQALAESTARYSQRVDRSRELFIGVLGHDLRSPLGAVLSSADYLLGSDGLPAPELKAASVIKRSGTRIRDLVSDLLDVTRTRLGESLPVAPRAVELSSICRDVVEEAQAHHPERTVTCNASGALEGSWDGARVGQLLGNLVENAVAHGAADRPVTVTASGDGQEVTLSVHNEGKPIPQSARRTLFEPLTQGEKTRRRNGGLGLGLYIARAIAQAHGGFIEVRSSEEEGTTFTAHLPR